MRNDYRRRGYNAPKGWRPRGFGVIHIDGDLHHEPKHNFVFNAEVEEDKLYMGLPCIHTDKNFDEEAGSNFFKSTYLFQSSRRYPKKHKNNWLSVNRNPKKWGKTPISLAACIRKIQNVKGIPKGTIIDINNHYYFRNSNSSPSYTYIHNGNNAGYIPDYQVNHEAYTCMFTDDEWGNELITKLRGENTRDKRLMPSASIKR